MPVQGFAHLPGSRTCPGRNCSCPRRCSCWGSPCCRAGAGPTAPAAPGPSPPPHGTSRPQYPGTVAGQPGSGPPLPPGRLLGRTTVPASHLPRPSPAILLPPAHDRRANSRLAPIAARLAALGTRDLGHGVQAGSWAWSCSASGEGIQRSRHCAPCPPLPAHLLRALRCGVVLAMQAQHAKDDHEHQQTEPHTGPGMGPELHRWHKLGATASGRA
jgi:hypothetical protein